MLHRCVFALSVCVTLTLAMPASAFFITGEFNGWDAAATAMTDNGDGTHTATLTGLAADTRLEFKITDGTWDTSWPGPNSWAYADGAGELIVTFTPGPIGDGWLTDENRIGVSTDPGAWTVAGSFQDPVWTNNDPATAMTALGNGLYEFTTTLDAGLHEFKFVNTGSWDSISFDGRSIATANATVELTESAPVLFELDALSGAARVSIIPEPASLALLGLGSLAMLRRRSV